MVCSLLDIRRKMRIRVSYHDPFLSNLGIAKCLDKSDCPWIIHRTLLVLLYPWISLLCTKFSLSSVNCNSVGKDTLQTWPRWLHQWEVLLTILPYQWLMQLQHPNTIEYCENRCVSLADIPHMKIYIFPQSITNPVWPLANQPSLWRSQIYRVLQIRNAAPNLCHAVTSNAWTFTHNYYVFICQGTCFHSDSQCSIWPATMVI